MSNLELNNNEKLGEQDPYDHYEQHDIDKGFLLVGTIILIFPQILCLVYLGIFPFILSAGTVLVGVITGIIMYKSFRYESIFNTDAVTMPKFKLKRTYLAEKNYAAQLTNLPIN